jgi:adenylate kinase family enzyme
MQRIVVVGTTGSGKTTLAAELARRLSVPHVELDALHWEANWVEAEREVFRERVSQVLSGDTWVVAGNYSKARDLVWSRADIIVWLDYPLSLILWRLLWRTVKRTITQQDLWKGNRERFREQFFSRDSLFLWALQSHPRHRRKYPADLDDPAYAHLRLVRLHSPRETEDWLARIVPPLVSNRL